MAVSKKTKAFYNKIFDGIETCAANVIQIYQERRLLNKYKPNKPAPKEYAKAYKKYWKKYGHYSPLWGWYYAARNGNMDVRYVPHTLYYTKIDQYFNNRKIAWGFNDKNYYDKIFAGIKQPETVVRKVGGVLLDDNYIQLSSNDALELICKNKEVICKPSQESGSGRDIGFWDTEKDIDKIKEFLTDKSRSDYIVQKILVQHDELNKVHQNSINTIRICSLLLEDGIHILSSVLRMGVDESRVDNATAGGITCGINTDGTLQKYAYAYYSGEKYTCHPQGYVFEGKKVPSYDKAVELVKSAHPVIGNFRLVSWDIAIDKNGEPVLIEANMRKGGINFHQFSNGAIFGELTDQILNEVLTKNGK